MNADRAQQVHQGAELLFDEATVDQAIVELAGKVEADCAADFPLVLCVMTGALLPTAGSVPLVLTGLPLNAVVPTEQSFQVGLE